MNLSEKEQPEKIFCLFHEKTGCTCIEPVTKEKNLIYRLEHQIRLNERTNKYAADSPEKAARERETEKCRARLAGLQNNHGDEYKP